MRVGLIACFLGLLLVPAMLAAQGLNGFPMDSRLPAGCWVSLSPNGPAVSHVPQSDGTANGTFWLNYNGAGNTSKMKFLVKFNSASPLKKHIQKFENLTAAATTPFAYPYWSGDVIMGPALLKVSTDTARCTYAFEAGGKSFESPDTPNIPNPGTVNNYVTVSGIGTIRKVAVTVSIVYHYDIDLNISLIGPDNTWVTLSDGNGGGGDNYGYTGYQRTVFDDEASTSIQDGTAPFVGIYRPETALSQFVGKSGAAANGTWTLQVQDTSGVNSGHVEAWSIIIAD